MTLPAESRCGRIARQATGSYVISSYKLPPGYSLPRHAHARPGLVAVLAGQLRICNGAREVEALAGFCIVLPAGLTHLEQARAGARCLLVELGSAGSLDGFGKATQNFTQTRMGPALQTARRLARGLPQEGTTTLELEADATELFLELQGRGEPGDSNGGSPWFHRVVEILRCRWQEPPRVTELASEAGVTIEHLARAFRRATGCTLGDYLRRQRLLNAARKLRESSLPLALVAQWAGYADQSHMTRQFRHYLGITPRAYRMRA